MGTYRVVLLSVVPRLEQPVSNREGPGLICSDVVEIESRAGQCILYVVHNLSLDGLDIGAEVGAHQLPHLLRALLGLIILKLRLYISKNNIFVRMSIKSYFPFENDNHL